MKQIEGMKEVFKRSKQVFLTTSNKKGESKTRAMTNFNESPYEPMWYPSFLDTTKIHHIKENPDVIISFPADGQGTWYKIRGKARLAPWEEVNKDWKWWYLEWVPREDREKHELRYDDPFTDRTIIWVDPVEAFIGDTQ